MKKQCSHKKIEFLGLQKGEEGMNYFYKCLRCGTSLIVSEDGVLYEVPKKEKAKTQ